MGLKSTAWRFPGLLVIFCMTCSVDAVGDITTTPHRLVRPGALKDASEICVFCHTPFIAEGSSVSATPLWQRSLGNAHTFTMYDDIGRLGSGGKPTVGSQSIACLSCHDANQAFSVTKASLDHPFGVPYRGFLKGQGVRGQPGTGTREKNEDSKSAKQLVSLNDFREPTKGVVDSRTVWWVSSSGSSALRTRGDLPLYLRRDELDQEVPFIECSSCHDPHSSNRLFLRTSNEGGRLCLTCHDK